MKYVKFLITVIVSLSILAGSISCNKSKDAPDVLEDDTLSGRPVEEVNQTADITGSGVNVRKGPGIDYAVEFQLNKGSVVEILDERFPDDAGKDVAFTEHEWVDTGGGYYAAPNKFEPGVMTTAYKIDEHFSLNKGMAVKVCFSADPGGHGCVHVEYVTAGQKDTLKLIDMDMVSFRDKVKPAGGTAWFKIRDKIGNTGWVYGDYVKPHEVTK